MMLRIVECFTSINGEGPRVGELAHFIRLKGCNLACSYCDTAWANSDDCPYVEKTVHQLAEEVNKLGITNVTLTGGEPLLQKKSHHLIAELITRGHAVEIETNGSISIEPLIPLKQTHPNRLFFTLDYKLPSSGMEHTMHLQNLRHLSENDAVKFVSASQEDLERAFEIIKTYDLDKRTQIFISPVFGAIDPQVIVDFMIQKKINAVKLQLQLHKVIWHPDMRGV